MEVIKTERSLMRYWPEYFKDKDYFSLLKEELTFHPSVVKVYNKEFVLEREQTGYGEEGAVYSYSGNSVTAIPFTPLLLELKNKVEEIVGAKINHYPANTYLGWHSDNERELISNPNPVTNHGVTVISLSFGQTRDFQIRRKGRVDGKLHPITTISLHDGDLLTMEGDFQKEFLHCVPKRARINLTFRLIEIPKNKNIKDK